jgi:anti-sigma B factor antagonist
MSGGAESAGLSMSVLSEEMGARLVVAGEVDTSSVDEFRAGLDAVLDHHSAMLTVDLAGVSFLDSRGISALVDAYHRAADNAAGLRVINCQSPVRRVLDVTGILALLGGNG